MMTMMLPKIWKMVSDKVSAVVPVEGYPTKMVALIGRNICYVDRETGMHFTQQTLLKMRLWFACLYSYNTWVWMWM